MNKARLRAIDPNVEHPLDIAAQRVKEFKLDREKDVEKPLPVSNQSDSGSPSLRVDDVLKRSESNLIGKK